MLLVHQWWLDPAGVRDELGLPLAGLSIADIAREAVRREIVETSSLTTVWRWLREDALRPWTYRSWLFPRDLRLRAQGGAHPQPVPRPLAGRALAA